MHKESEIEIEVLPANEGDCILIKAVKEDIHILIDGGTAEIYRNYLRARLNHVNCNLRFHTHISD